MPKITRNPIDEELGSAMEKENAAHIVQTQGTLVCGVGRKINIGDYENLDVYSSVTLPIDISDVVEMDDLKSIIESVADVAFEAVSRETGARYRLIKEKMRAAPRVEA